METARIANRYEVINKLGQGGMGAVWRVYDRLEKTQVALKQVLIPENQLDFASKAGTDDTDKLRLSLAHEFSILATLRHPHILSVLDFGFDDDGQPFYTMTLLEGGQDVKTYATNISTGKRIKLMGQMLQALHYLHRRGVLHRDLKPDNVFVTRDEQIKVMDFGLAKQEKVQSTQSDTIKGTISYMAPELFQGGKATVASDLFAVGVTVYEIMVGQHPFAGKTIGERILNIMTHTPDFSAIPDDFSPWLETTLEKEPANRFQTAYDAMAEFYKVFGLEIPAEDEGIRESFLQASEFVGREAEFEQLTDALEKIKTENAFFLVGGESGIGKSRLLEELRIQALVKGVMMMRGQGVEGGGLPFQLWREIVRRMLLVVEVTDLQAGILQDIVPDVIELLGRDITQAPELTGKAYQDRLSLTIVDLFRNLPQPVVLLLEDLQWTGESLLVLQQMLKVPEQLPNLMVVANYRDDETPDLPEKLVGMTHIKLERLDADAISELSRAMLGDAGANEEVAKLLYSQSEGNLFFLVETVRALAEASGDLQRIGQGELPEGVFTGGMQALTRRHLSKVDSQYAEIQTLAAVIGREIDTQLLAHAYDDSTVDAWLSNAADNNVISIQDNTWRFAHDKLREAILADIPDDASPQIHRTAAEAIEAVYPHESAYNETLLNHWHIAGDLEKVYHYLLPVVENMIWIQGAYTPAEVLLQRLLDQLPTDDRRSIALWNSLADSTRFNGDYETSKQHAEKAKHLATILNESAGLAKSLNRLGSVADKQGDYAGAIALFQQSLMIAQELDDKSLIATCVLNLGRIATYQAEYERAAEFYQQGLEIYQALGDQRGIASSLNNLGNIAGYQSEYARAGELFQQSLALYKQLGNQHGIASSISNLGRLANHLGDDARAIELYEQARDLYKRLGAQDAMAHSLNALALTAIKQKDYAQANALYHEALGIMQQLGNSFFEAVILDNLGFAARITEPEKMRSYFARSLAIAYRLNALSLVLDTIVGFTWVALQDHKTLRAAHLAGLVRTHPALINDVQHSLDVVMARLQELLPEDALQAELEHGASLDLDTVVAELLDEFAPDEE